MKMYKSPIEIITEQIRINNEDAIFRAIQNVGINIDKKELLKGFGI